VPAYVDSPEALIQEMKRQGVNYLVFDRKAGTEGWPKLASLSDVDRPHPGLQALRQPIRTEESQPNLVAIYKLE
jgi:hypothetical protein